MLVDIAHDNLTTWSTAPIYCPGIRCSTENPHTCYKIVIAQMDSRFPVCLRVSGQPRGWAAVRVPLLDSNASQKILSNQRNKSVVRHDTVC